MNYQMMYKDKNGNIEKIYPKTKGYLVEGFDDKVDKELGKGLSSNDYTDKDKDNLSKLINDFSNLLKDFSNKVDKEDGKGLSSNDFTNEDKENLVQLIKDIGDKIDKEDVYTKTEVDKIVIDKVAEIVADAPEDFDTLKEMSDWISSHKEDVTQMNSDIKTNAENIKNKVDKELGKGLSSNDFTNEDKDNLDNLVRDFSNKVDKEDGKGLSSNDFTDIDKNNLDNLVEELSELSDGTKKLSSNDFTDIDKNNLDNLVEGFDDKVDKELGKGLSSNDFTNEDKDNLDNLVEGIDDVKNDVAIVKSTLGYTSKNLLENIAETTTYNGITYTVNNNGSVTINGTATELTSLTINSFYKGGNIKAGDILTFGSAASNTNIICFVDYYDDTMTWQAQDIDNSNGIILKDYQYYKVIVKIERGKTVSNLKIYPMIRHADVTDDTYEPYKPSVDTRLIENKSDTAINKTTLGYQAKNLLKLYYPSGHEYTNTDRNTIWTFNDDYSVSMNVTSQISSGVAYQIAEITLKKGTYIYSVEGYSTPDITHTQLYSLNSDGSWNWLANLSAIENKIIVTKETTYSFRAYRNSAVKVGTIQTFYPMLRYIDVSDSTFEPYKENVDDRLKKLFDRNDFTDEEKDKLAGVETGANNYKLPTASTTTLGGVKSESTATSADHLTPVPIINGVPYYKYFGAKYGLSSSKVVGTNGVAGYVLLFTINISQNYINSPIEIVYTQRGSTNPEYVHLSILFDNKGNTDPDLSSFVYYGASSAQAYIVKSNTSEWKIYVRKSEAYDEVDIITYSIPLYLNGVTMTKGTTQVSSLPDGYIKAARGGYVYGARTVIASQTQLYKNTSVLESSLTINIANLFTNYSAIICNITTEKERYSHVLPLRYIKSLGTEQYYTAEEMLYYYMDDNNIQIRTGLGQGNPIITMVDIISLY